jgi:hypothetical protein
MKKIVIAAFGLAVVFVSSCKKDVMSDAHKDLVVGSTVDTLRGEITVNTTLTKKTYLQGLVYVKPGVILTVNAGVTIVGSAGPAIPDTVNLSNNKGVLLIEKGAKLIANGTATSPIIWTSSKPAGSRAYGDWGGVVFYGNAPIHRANGASTGLFEAFDYKPDERNRYGGSNASDNSGSVTYNRFEFGGGVVYQIDKEVNGVTFCGVGSGTTFHHNEVLYSGDDGMEFFGGNINIHHTLVFGSHDDDYDFDEGFSGKLQFIIGYRTDNADNSGSHNIESDNDASGTNASPYTSAFISNATFIGPATAKNFSGAGSPYFDGSLFLRRNSRLTLVNSLIIAQQHPYAVVTTPTTVNRVANAPGLSPDSIVISYNIFQTNSVNPVVSSTVEGNPVPSGTTTNNALLGILGNVSNGNTALASMNDFKLTAELRNTPASPSYKGGANLAALGLPFFQGTTERGAVISSDPWTSTGNWISIATN